MSDDEKPNRFDRVLDILEGGSIGVTKPPPNGSGYKSHGTLKQIDQKAIREALEIASRSLSEQPIHE